MHFVEVSKSPTYLRWRPCCLIVYNTTEIQVKRYIRLYKNSAAEIESFRQ